MTAAWYYRQYISTTDIKVWSPSSISGSNIGDVYSHKLKYVTINYNSIWFVLYNVHRDRNDNVYDATISSTLSVNLHHSEWELMLTQKVPDNHVSGTTVHNQTEYSMNLQQTDTAR